MVLQGLGCQVLGGRGQLCVSRYVPSVAISVTANRKESVASPAVMASRVCMMVTMMKLGTILNTSDNCVNLVWSTADDSSMRNDTRPYLVCTDMQYSLGHDRILEALPILVHCSQ